MSVLVVVVGWLVEVCECACGSVCLCLCLCERWLLYAARAALCVRPLEAVRKRPAQKPVSSGLQVDQVDGLQVSVLFWEFERLRVKIDPAKQTKLLVITQTLHTQKVD